MTHTLIAIGGGFLAGVVLTALYLNRAIGEAHKLVSETHQLIADLRQHTDKIVSSLRARL